ncbi:MAG: MBL fold metallo-hydrolase [Acidobacteria bacterium]|jgi:glyoxylase-like metal-dependent hydrolase (beta-lactamase superfamily II)|nr:MBL fold metallo-hydrolase [Acidobacteriota bacterium]
MPSPLAAGVDFADLNFVGQPGIIATGLIHGADGVAIIDPGPATCLPTLEAALTARGFSWSDVRAVLLTHIHLDHAGATGHVLRAAPSARLYVHERGARHMIDPSKLLASAARLYQGDMDRLWGEMLPVPADRVEVLGERNSLSIVGHEVESAWTPGHAWHHVSYFLSASKVAFVGDTAGICRPSGRVVLPPTPPPDIDLEAWRTSTETILAWNPEVLLLTHFGPQASPRGHFQELWRRMDAWCRRVQISLTNDLSDAERSDAFVKAVVDELERTTSRAEAEAYARAGRFDFSWTGLARYLRNRVRPSS